MSSNIVKSRLFMKGNYACPVFADYINTLFECPVFLSSIIYLAFGRIIL